MTSAFEHSTICTIFTVYIQLTELGSANVDRVCEIVFDYVKQIYAAAQLSKQKHEENSIPIGVTKQNNFTLFIEELAAIAQSNFIYTKPKENSTFCEELAEMMQIVPMEHVLSAGRLIKKHDIDLYVRLLELMTPENACILHSSASFIERLNLSPRPLRERWFGIEYMVQDMGQSSVDLSKNAQVMDALHLPLSNDYIPRSYDILPSDDDLELPIDLNLDPDGANRLRYGHLWFQRTSKYRLPTAYFAMHFWSPGMSQSMKDSLLLELLIIIQSNSIAAACQDAEAVGMHIKLSTLMNGVLLEVSGFSDQLYKSYSNALNVLLGDSGIISSSHFEQYIRIMEDYFHKRIMDTSALTQDICSYLTDSQTYLPQDMLHSFKDISTADFMAFKQRIFRNLHLTAFVFGNITREEAIRLYDYTTDELRSLPVAERKMNATISLPPGIYQMRFVACSTWRENSCCIHLHLLGRTDLKGKILTLLLAFILSGPADDYFTTHERVASRVSIRPWIHKFDGNSHRGLSLEIWSPQNVDLIGDVTGRMDFFWYYMIPRIIAAIPSDNYRQTVDSLARHMQSSGQSMQQVYENTLAIILMEEIVDFEQKLKSIEILKSTTREDLLEFFVENYMNTREKTHFTVLMEMPPSQDESTTVRPTKLVQLQQTETTLAATQTVRSQLSLKASLHRAGYRTREANDRLKNCKSRYWTDDILNKAFDSVHLVNNMKRFRSTLETNTSDSS